MADFGINQVNPIIEQKITDRQTGYNTAPNYFAGSNYINDSYEPSISRKEPEKSFLQKHWEKILAGAAVVGGVILGIKMFSAEKAVKQVVETEPVRKFKEDISQIFDGVWTDLSNSFKEQGLPEIQKPKITFLKSKGAITTPSHFQISDNTINVDHELLQEIVKEMKIVKSVNKTHYVPTKKAFDDAVKEGHIKPDAEIRSLNDVEKRAFYTCVLTHESTHSAQDQLALHSYKKQYLETEKNDLRKILLEEVKKGTVKFKESDITDSIINDHLQTNHPFVWNFKPHSEGKINYVEIPVGKDQNKMFYSSEDFLRGHNDILTDVHKYSGHTDAGYYGNPMEIHANLNAYDYLQRKYKELFLGINKWILDCISKDPLNQAKNGIKSAQEAGITYAMPLRKNSDGTYSRAKYEELFIKNRK